MQTEHCDICEEKGTFQFLIFMLHFVTSSLLSGARKSCLVLCTCGQTGRGFRLETAAPYGLTGKRGPIGTDSREDEEDLFLVVVSELYEKLLVTVHLAGFTSRSEELQQ